MNTLATEVIMNQAIEDKVAIETKKYVDAHKQNEEDEFEFDSET